MSFNNRNGNRVIDSTNFVPQLIQRLDYATLPYTDYTDSDGSGEGGLAHPGYNMRIYSVPYAPEIANRPHITLWKMPEYAGGNCWMSSTGVVQWSGNVAFSAPVRYIFALDYVTQSSDAWGMRIWGEMVNGVQPLMFDTGCKHLSIYEVMTGLTVDLATTGYVRYPDAVGRSFDSANLYFPQPTPIFLLTNVEIYADFGARFNGYGNWRAATFWRAHGCTIDTRSMRTDFEYTYDANSANYNHIYKSNGSVGMVTMVVDPQPYD